MITKTEASDLASKEVNGSEYVLVEEPITEGSYGWVFRYQSAKYLETGNFSDMLVGNAPFLVEKSSGKLHVLGTARPVEWYVQNFLNSGDPHRQ